MCIRRRTILFTILSLVMLVSTARAQVLKNEFELIPANGPGGVTLGHAVDISGDTAVMTMQNPAGLGVAYTFRFAGGAWLQDGVLGLPGGSLADAFGWDVAIDGDTAVVTAPFNGNVTYHKGAAFVFERAGGVWLHTATLEAPEDFGDGTVFGMSVALKGNVLVVSDYSNSDQGRVVMFERSGSAWTATANLVPPAPQDKSLFGGSLAMDGDTIVASSPMYPGAGKGSVHVFRYAAGGSWQHLAQLSPAGVTPGDGFGTSVDIDAGRIVAGAPGSNGDSGVVWLFSKNLVGEWTNTPAFTTTLEPKSAAAGQSFGFSVAIAGDYVLVGSPFDGDNGSVQVFSDLSGMGTPTVNVASNGLGGGQFGWSVAIDGTRAVVGANQHAGDGTAYAYDVLKDWHFPVLNWVFTQWPYHYIYTGCPLWILQNTAATIEMDRGTLPLRFSISQAPRNGRLVFTSDTTLEYRPNRGFTGSDVFTIQVADPSGALLARTANVTVVAR